MRKLYQFNNFILSMKIIILKVDIEIVLPSKYIKMHHHHQHHHHHHHHHHHKHHH